MVTDLQHDWLGRRRRITRGDRAWRYDYDLNGNSIREIAPVPAGASEAAYTSSTVYDDLDRPTSRLAGVRALSAAEQTAINHGLVTFSYDEGQNGIGLLTAVASRDSVLSRAYAYDARGNPVSETLSFDSGARARGADRGQPRTASHLPGARSLRPGERRRRPRPGYLDSGPDLARQSRAGRPRCFCPTRPGSLQTRSTTPPAWWIPSMAGESSSA